MVRKYSIWAVRHYSVPLAAIYYVIELFISKAYGALPY